MDVIARLNHRLHGLSMFQRIVIGNAIVIAIGAIAGTLLTSHLADQEIDLWLIFVFSILGTGLAVLTNSWIIRNALRPIRELSDQVRNIGRGISGIDTHILDQTDPEIRQLTAAIRSFINQLEIQNLKLQALSRHAISAQEEERKRIARGLHDDTGQALSMLIINLQRLEGNLPASLEDAESFRRKLSSTRELASRTLDTLRETIFGLRPTILDDLGLLPAIRWYARSVLGSEGVRVNFSVPDGDFQLSSDLTTTLFRITQEAINNIERHAEARNVTISLCRRMGNVVLRVDDDGRGFDVDRTDSQAVRLKKLGLLGIRERVDLIGGKVNVDSTPGTGTRLQVSVKLPLDNGVQQSGKNKNSHR